MTKKRFLVALGLGCALALTLAGCGAQPFPTTEVHPSGTTIAGTTTAKPVTLQARLLAAVPRATEEKTARIAMTLKASGGRDSDNVSMSGSGVVDLQGRRLSMEFSADAQGGTYGEAVAFDIRVVGGKLYYESDGTWETQTLDQTHLASPNPQTFLSYLQGVSDDVRVGGRAILRGVPTTRYTATLDYARVLAHAPAATRGTELPLLGALKIPATVWLDDAGRLRRFDVDIDLSSVAVGLGLPAGSHPEVVESLELYDFGVPVSVPVPPGAITPAAAAADDNATQSDLRNALTAEKVQYTDTEQYTADATPLKAIEPSLDWGHKLTVAVGGGTGGPGSVVCLAERSASGTTFAIADVATGTSAGSYYARIGCPNAVSENTVSTLSRSW